MTVDGIKNHIHLTLKFGPHGENLALQQQPAARGVSPGGFVVVGGSEDRRGRRPMAGAHHVCGSGLSAGDCPSVRPFAHSSDSQSFVSKFTYAGRVRSGQFLPILHNFHLQPTPSLTHLLTPSLLIPLILSSWPQ